MIEILFARSTDIAPGSLAVVQANAVLYSGVQTLTLAQAQQAVNNINAGGQALTEVNDTNVTLTLDANAPTSLLTASVITVGWTGTLAAGRLNSNVVQAFTNDTNIHASITAQNATLSWSGTLAAARLNANVVQSIVNDTNVTGTISAQALTLGWTGTLANARLANMAANTFKGNLTSGSAAPTDFTIDGLTAKGSPTTSDELIIWDVAGTAIKKATLGTLPTATFTPGQYQGTATNDNATAGNIGEYISSNVASGSAISVASATSTNITSVSLTAGDWDCRGNIATVISANITSVAGWISSTSATDPGSPNGGAYTLLGALTGGILYTTALTAPIGAARFSLAGTTTVYLSVRTSAAGSNNFYGFIGCRRCR